MVILLHSEQNQGAAMKNIPTYKNINELIDTLKQMKKEGCLMEEEITFFPIQPVRIGDKIGFVDWANCELECLPLFEDYDREFTSFCDCICVRQGNKWGVLNAYFKFELPIDYPYAVANQVCNVMNTQYVQSRSIRSYGTYMSFS